MKNIELRAIVRLCHELGAGIAQEPSAGMSIGLDEHALKRQRQYIMRVLGMVESVHEKPIPDAPRIHPTEFPADLTKLFAQFTADNLAINKDTELLSTYWMTIAVEMALSQSATLAGSMTDADYTRAKTNLGVITQYLDELEKAVPLDIPETAHPEAQLSTPDSTTKR